MKKIFTIALSLLMLSACFAFAIPAEATSGESIVLNVYNWGEYISDGSEDSYNVNAEFEKYYKETYGVNLTVNYTTYASNEDLYAKLKSGAVGYDVVIPSDYMIQLMIEENMLEKLDFTNIPNYVNIADKYRNQYFDPNNEYSVPYAVGMVGIIYNTEMVEGTPDKSWSLMWNEAYKGKILNFNNPRDAFGTAMYYLGIDVNTGNTADWDTAFEKLKEQKPLLQGYVMDEVFNKMENGSAAIAPYYAGDFLTMYGENDKLAFYYPKEGTNTFIDSVCIPKGAKNKLAAERYIDFLLSEETAVANAEYICYASPNKLVTENAEYIEYMGELHDDAMSILYPELDEDYKATFFKDLPTETREYMNKHWESLKSVNTMSFMIYILIGVVVVAVVSCIVYFIVRKKKRQKIAESE